MSVWWSDAAKARCAELEDLDLTGRVTGDGVDKEKPLGPIEEIGDGKEIPGQGRHEDLF